MNQEERLDYLIEAFKTDSVEYKTIQTPTDTAGKKKLLRSLMNIRMPAPLPEEVIEVQDEYLSLRSKEIGVVRSSDIPVIKDGISIWQGDITRLAVDAIVNAANSQMLGCFVPMHTCIDNCIHTFAGIQLRTECNRQMNVTDAYNLPARKVIHIVGPIVNGSLTPDLEKDLADCYLNSLDMCASNGLKSVAFCCISTGVFCFPNDRACRIAVQTVTEWTDEHPGIIDRVIFNVFKDEDRRLYESELR